jgi:hypothetical protein
MPLDFSSHRVGPYQLATHNSVDPVMPSPFTHCLILEPYKSCQGTPFPHPKTLTLAIATAKVYHKILGSMSRITKLVQDRIRWHASEKMEMYLYTYISMCSELYTRTLQHTKLKKKKT